MFWICVLKLVVEIGKCNNFLQLIFHFAHKFAHMYGKGKLKYRKYIAILHAIPFCILQMT